MLALTALGILLASIPGYIARFQGQLGHATGNVILPGAPYFAAASGVASLASSLLSIGLAVLLFRRKFTEPIAALLSYFLLIYGVVMSGPLENMGELLPGLQRFTVTFQSVLLATPMIALLALFPTGQFVPRWTRWMVLASLPMTVGLFLLAPFDAESLNRNLTLTTIVTLLFLFFSLVGIYAQVFRYRNASTPIERGQIRWAIYGFALWFAYIFVSTIPYMILTNLPPEAPTPWWGPASELGWWLSLNLLPISLTIAITRHQLWDIDLVINRTLVYGALTASVLALYALVVGGMSLIFRTDDGFILPLLATGLAAIIFHPLRVRLQGAINRMMYGERDDPVAVLSKLGEHLEQAGDAEFALTCIVETIAQALKLPYAAIELGQKTGIAAVYGIPAHPTLRLPLIFQSEPVGELIVAYRSREEPFSPQDHRLLENIAYQAGAAAHNVRLTADLRRSRQTLVTTREEERRRIRRDLHDGLGPQLASQTLTLDAIEKLIDRNPEQAKALLKDLKTQSKDAITDIRRLIYDLRPPALDDLGLVAALRQEWERNPIGERPHAGDAAPNGVHISLAVPVPLPPLPAAVELAAYRIVQEAVNNVIKHAQAITCTVRLEIQRQQLCVEISDDGRGFPDGVRSGIGLQSMRERAEELGGRLEIDMRQRGARVCAWLPVQVEL